MVVRIIVASEEIPGWFQVDGSRQGLTHHAAALELFLL